MINPAYDYKNGHELKTTHPRSPQPRTSLVSHCRNFRQSDSWCNKSAGIESQKKAFKFGEISKRVNACKQACTSWDFLCLLTDLPLKIKTYCCQLNKVVNRH